MSFGGPVLGSGRFELGETPCVARPRLVVRDLCMADHAGNEILRDVSFTAEAESVTALIGESGCGKTSVALALLGYARPGMRIVSGGVSIDGTEMLELDERALRGVRGATISYVPQSPASSLNPRRRIGAQVEEVLIDQGWARTLRRERVREVFSEVALPDRKDFLDRYPFELSGGQLQRVAIAMAVVARPRVVVLDEPTTGLDVTTQGRILDLVQRLVREVSAALVYVTHDLAVVERIADRIAVMYAGRVVELGPQADVLRDPAHPYSQMLLDAVPRRLASTRPKGIPGFAPRPGERPQGCAFAPRCPHATDECSAAMPELVGVGEGRDARCVRVDDVQRSTPPGRDRIEVRQRAEAAPASSETGSPQPLLTAASLVAEYHGVRVLDHVGLELEADECVGVVGESGSGKTTLARCIAGLHTTTSGELSLDGRHLAPSFRRRSPEDLRAVQLVFQSSDRALNPRETVWKALRRAVALPSNASHVSAHSAISDALDRVRLPARVADLYPSDLSGGERQRVAIARALATKPRLLICDEITSALDVSIQAAIVELLAELRASGVAMLFITHNLPLVSSIADRVMVLKSGQVVEAGSTQNVIGNPQASYTRDLLDAAPELSSR